MNDLATATTIITPSFSNVTRLGSPTRFYSPIHTLEEIVAFLMRLFTGVQVQVVSNGQNKIDIGLPVQVQYIGYVGSTIRWKIIGAERSQFKSSMPVANPSHQRMVAS
jgi:hypothetical protein